MLKVTLVKFSGDNAAIADLLRAPRETHEIPGYF